MEGREVFRHAVVKHLGEAVDAAIGANGLSRRRYRLAGAASGQPPDHRRHGRSAWHLPAEKVIVTVDRHANTSAASIPLALDEAVRDGRIRPGHLVLMEAMGGGFTWGSALVRW